MPNRRNGSSLFIAAIALVCGSTVAAFGCHGTATVTTGEPAAPTASPVAAAPTTPPPPVDTDNDGIPDDKDACKDKAGVANADPAKNGCPEEAPKAMAIAAVGKVKVENNEIKISEKIMFDTGKATIKAESDKLLDEIAEFLKTNKSITLIEVGGHADKQGDEKKNVELTQARAAAVVDALVKRGVDPKILRAKGYGPFCPEDAGNTPEAFEKNRRVQFAILKLDGKKTGFKLGCEEAVKKGIKPQPIF